jgi:hypothetical protein
MMAAAIAAAAVLVGLAGQAAAQAGAVSRDFLIGRWTDTDNCSNAVDFYADGRFLTTGGASGRWVLENGRLSFIGNSTVTARIHSEGRNRIVLTHNDGSVGQSTRCPTPSAAAARRTMPPLPATIADALAMSRPFAPQLLIGRWTDDGDCGNLIEFRANGEFITAAASGRWQLVGEQLSFIGDRTVTARARAVGNDRVLLIHPEGSLGQSVRC